MRISTKLERGCANYLNANLSKLDLVKLFIHISKRQDINSFDYLALSVEQEQKRLKEIERAEQFQNSVMGELYARHIIEMLEEGANKNERK